MRAELRGEEVEVVLPQLGEAGAGERRLLDVAEQVERAGDGEEFPGIRQEVRGLVLRRESMKTPGWPRRPGSMMMGVWRILSITAGGKPTDSTIWSWASSAA